LWLLIILIIKETILPFFAYRCRETGNRSSTSQSGSADVLEALGARLEYDVQKVINTTPSSTPIFLFAPLFHPVMKYIAPIRKGLEIPTVFNILGPLLNPASVAYQLIGTPSKKKADLIAQTIQQLPHKKVAVVYNQEGLDELSTIGDNTVYHIENGLISTEIINATDYGLARASLDDLRGGTPQENAITIQSILKGDPGPFRDITLLNAGYALWIAQATTSLSEGIDLARHSIDSGKSQQASQQFITSTGITHE
jgi:anthranilate phosphoribosyltransferase